MQQGLPPIDEDPHVALKRAYSGLRRDLFDPPDMPAEYLNVRPDLGSLAVRGPFACYTTRGEKTAPTGSGTCCRSTTYDHQDDLMKIGLAGVIPPG